MSRSLSMQREDIILTKDARVAEITLDANEISPKHFHSDVIENVICMSGIIELYYGDNDEYVVLRPGQRHKLVAGVVHNLVNQLAETSTYLLIQKGDYDFVLVNS